MPPLLKQPICDEVGGLKRGLGMRLAHMQLKVATIFQAFVKYCFPMKFQHTNYDVIITSTATIKDNKHN